MIFEWTSDLELGFQEIDSQHKELFRIINDLGEANLHNQLEEKLPKLLERMESYTKYHFATEEALFVEFGYVHASDHIESHQHLAQRVRDFIEDFEKEGRKIANDLSLFLGNWLIDHVKKEDRQYVQCFRDHGYK